MSDNCHNGRSHYSRTIDLSLGKHSGARLHSLAPETATNVIQLFRPNPEVSQRSPGLLRPMARTQPSENAQALSSTFENVCSVSNQNSYPSPILRCYGLGTPITRRRTRSCRRVAGSVDCCGMYFQKTHSEIIDEENNMHCQIGPVNGTRSLVREVGCNYSNVTCQYHMVLLMNTFLFARFR